MRIIVLPCDGIGPEIVGAAMKVLDRVNEKFQLGLTFDSEDVGFTSLGTFSRMFRDIVGVNPTDYRARGDVMMAPTCYTMAWMRPSQDRALLEKRSAQNGQ